MKVLIGRKEFSSGEISLHLRRKITFSGFGVRGRDTVHRCRNKKRRE
jgi:hypothetical protein